MFQTGGNSYTTSWRKGLWRAGSMTPSVNCLLCKHDDLTSEPQNLRKNQGVIAPDCKPSAGGGDMRIPQAHWPASLAQSTSIKFSERPCVKKKRWGAKERYLTCSTSAHMCPHIHEHTLINIYITPPVVV